MTITKKLGKEINGFKIIKDLGRNETGRRALVICKECKKKYETSAYYLKTAKSCGCISIYKKKKLSEYINGFKILKDLGKNNSDKQRMILVECKVCKKDYEIELSNITRRKSCGCINHGGKVCSYVNSHPRLRRIYTLMMRRCYYKKDSCYYLYGYKNIIVCNEWREHPDNFCKWALENGYSDNLSIDRLDNNGNYEPTNCRWADTKTQGRNRSFCKITLETAKQIRIDKLTMNQKQLAKKYNVSNGTISLIVKNKSWA
jgi:hypothetical protein